MAISLACCVSLFLAPDLCVRAYGAFSALNGMGSGGRFWNCKWFRDGLGLGGPQRRWNGQDADHMGQLIGLRVWNVSIKWWAMKIVV